MLDNPHRRHALANHFGNLLIVQPLDKPQQDHLALLVLELKNRFVDRLFIRGLVQGLLRISSQLLVHVSVFKREVLAPGAQIADRQVVCDSQEPGDNRRASLLVANDRLLGFQKGLSGQIFRLFSVMHQGVDVPVNRNNVPVI